MKSSSIMCGCMVDHGEVEREKERESELRTTQDLYFTGSLHVASPSKLVAPGTADVILGNIPLARLNENLTGDVEVKWKAHMGMN